MENLKSSLGVGSERGSRQESAKSQLSRPLSRDSHSQTEVPNAGHTHCIKLQQYKIVKYK